MKEYLNSVLSLCVHYTAAASLSLQMPQIRREKGSLIMLHSRISASERDVSLFFNAIVPLVSL